MAQSIEQAGLMLLAPAKLNLTLEVLGKRSDGFHEIRSILQTIDLWDSVYMELKPRGIDFHCSEPELENSENLVWQAAESLRALQTNKGISIRLQKGIPEAAGLGGGSSDTAATLKGLNYVWGTDLEQEKLASLASQLSSDAPFFLIGGTALAQGRGELLTTLPSLPPHWVVILKPDIPVASPKTARLYGSLMAAHYTKGEHTARLQDKLFAGLPDGKINEFLFNVFDQVAYQVYPGLMKYMDSFKGAGALSVHLAGSGPALFTIISEKEKAEKIYTNLKQEGLEVYLARTRN